jgi:hypothetical protein
MARRLVQAPKSSEDGGYSPPPAPLHLPVPRSSEEKRSRWSSSTSTLTPSPLATLRCAGQPTSSGRQHRVAQRRSDGVGPGVGIGQLDDGGSASSLLRPIYLQRAPRRPNPMAVRPSSSLVAGSSDAGSTVSKAVAAGSTASNATVAPPGGSGSWAGYGPSMGSERAYRWAFGFFLFFKSIYRDGHCNAPTCIDLLTEAVILKRPPWLIY